MLQAISVLVIVYFGVLWIRSWNSAGIALGLAWSLYVMEQLLQQSVPVLLQHKYLVNLIVSLSVATAAVHSVLRGRVMHVVRVSGVPTQLLAIFLLIGLCSVSAAWSVSGRDTVQQLILHLPYLLVFVLVTPLCATDRGAISSAVEVTTNFGGLILLGLAFSTFGSRGVVLELYDGNRLNEGNPLEIGSYGATVALCVLIQLYCSKMTMFRRLFLLSIAGLGVYATVRSQSRGQLVALVISLMVWLPVLSGLKKSQTKIVALATAASMGLFSFIVLKEMEMLDRWRGESLRSAGIDRLGAITTLWNAYVNGGVLVWLVGLGSSASFFYSETYPHNVPFEVLCELGLLGFGVFLYFSAATVLAGKQLLATRGLSPAARVNVGVLLSVFSFHALLTLKQGSLLGSAFFLSFASCVAWVIPRYRMVAAPEKAKVLERSASPICPRMQGV